MGQEGNSNEDHKMWAALGRMEIPAEMLEKWVITLDSELYIDIGAWPSICRMAVEKFTIILMTVDGIQANSAVTGNRKKGIRKRIDRIMDIIDGKMEEVTDYRKNKKQTGPDEIARCEHSCQDSQG